MREGEGRDGEKKEEGGIGKASRGGVVQVASSWCTTELLDSI